MFNLSDTVLTTRQREILGLGLDFCLPISKLNFLDYYISFESFNHNITKINEVCNNLYNDQIPTTKKKIANIAHKYFELTKIHVKKRMNNLLINQEDIKELMTLKENETIIISRSRI